MWRCASGTSQPGPEAVRQELDRLKALYDGFHYRELARILFVKFGYPLMTRPSRSSGRRVPSPVRGTWGCGTTTPSPIAIRPGCRSSQLYYQGWEKISIHRFLHVSRPTVDAWIRRFEAEHFAGLVDKSRGAPSAGRKVWLPLMVQVYHLQKAHPDAGGFRIWSLLARADVSVRTVGRIMALNRLVYDDIPHVPTRG